MGRDRSLPTTSRFEVSFNPRARVGRDKSELISSRLNAGFNPRARVGRDLNTRDHSTTSVVFQSTRPRGARRGNAFGAQGRAPVSIHAPAWGATKLGYPLRYTSGVSIHAPAWGATGEVRRHGDRHHVSIHAPAWGATHRLLTTSTAWCSFNPRARVGRDATHDVINELRVVSIHAPAWGATRRFWYTTLSACVFQSTRPRGARPKLAMHNGAGDEFQSTRPRGARRVELILRREGAAVSIHAPAWGATRCGGLSRMDGSGFNPRARVGRDWFHGFMWIRSFVRFQSTRPRGARLTAIISASHALEFQSTRPRGARRPRQHQVWYVVRCFNPRARVGRDPFSRPAWCQSDCFNPRARVGRDQARAIPL